MTHTKNKLLLYAVLTSVIGLFVIDLNSKPLYSREQTTHSYEQVAILADQLRPVDVIGAEKIRIGRDQDGGYIMIDQNGFDRLYSYGIADDISFETAFVKRWPVQAYLYDHTIEGLPPHEHPELLHWKKEGIAPTKLPYLNSLTAHIAENGDSTNHKLVLKMDVEGAEWESLLSTDDEVLSQFRQIILELHGLSISEWDTGYATQKAMLTKLNRLFYLVHVHGNNNSPIYIKNGILMPDAIEVTYLRKDPDITVRQSLTEYPIKGLDYPNNRTKQDIPLGRRPFRTLPTSINLFSFLRH